MSSSPFEHGSQKSASRSRRPASIGSNHSRYDTMASDSETTNGSGSRIFFPAGKVTVGGTAANNRLFVEAVLYAIERHPLAWPSGAFRRLGRTSPALPPMVRKRRFRADLQDPGEDRDNEYMMIDAPSCAPISIRRKKTAAASHRPIARRGLNHQDPCTHRRPGQSPRADAHIGSKLRSCLRATADRERRPDALIDDKAYDAVRSSKPSPTQHHSGQHPRPNRKTPQRATSRSIANATSSSASSIAQALPRHRHTRDRNSRAAADCADPLSPKAQVSLFGLHGLGRVLVNAH